jgi:hypothetical protein
MAEGQRLQRITRTAKDPVKLRRAIVVLMSAQGQPAPRRIDEQTRDWICVIARCDPRFLGRPFSC